MDVSLIKLCWLAFGDMILKDHEIETGPSNDDLFREHGHQYQIGSEQIRAPVNSCMQSQCLNQRLVDERKTECKLFTLTHGALPVWSVSLYCKRCSTRYYPNYSVTSASKPEAIRTYYEGMPKYIQVTDHSYIEPDLAIWIETEMAFSHSSAQSISRVYNLALNRSADPADNKSTFLKHKLDGELVLDGFFIHAILRDKLKAHQCLRLPHHGSHEDRLTKVLDERNLRMAGTGQEMWAHACKGCMKTYTGEDGRKYVMTAGVTDGVTVGHPCCRIHDCKVPLAHHHHRYCPQHRALGLKCRVKNCPRGADPSFKTCNLPMHRAAEDSPRPSLSQLCSRLYNLGVPQVPWRGEASQSAPELQPTPRAGTNHGGSDAGPKAPKSLHKPKTQFGRLWTHNEQLFVRCCGVIISRATFYGSEGVAGVKYELGKDFLKVTFPVHLPGALPAYIFYDNNCRLMAHLLHTNDVYFAGVGLPVDVFHFKSKHKETDSICQTHCNPAHFQELVGEADQKNQWVFNSSVAEQANIWFGRFASIVREMKPSRYNFYLDEMIAIRNQWIVSELRRTGKVPHLMPTEVLCGQI